MSTTTNGQLCYGIRFDEDYEFPWSDTEGEYDEGDIEEWWKQVKGYVNPLENPYIDGKYKPGFSKDDPRVHDYWAHSRDWLAQNPVPVALVNYQHVDYAAYILASPSTLLEARRGYPELLGTDTVTLHAKPEWKQELIEFCLEHGIEYNEEDGPAWWLSSYWG